MMDNEDFSDEEEMQETFIGYVDYSIDGEIKELLECQKLAQNIKEETKAIELVEALDVAFNRIKAIGGNRKALIFTESRRTQ
jgi:phage terminase Nu1 subunit (DNA packaging protein)